MAVTSKRQTMTASGEVNVASRTIVGIAAASAAETVFQGLRLKWMMVSAFCLRMHPFGKPASAPDQVRGRLFLGSCVFRFRMVSSESRYPLFRIMRQLRA